MNSAATPLFAAQLTCQNPLARTCGTKQLTGGVNMLRYGSFRIVCAIAGAFLFEGGAHAESTTAPSASATEGKPEVLVITAERRTTDLQDTGVSASVLTSEDLVDKSVYGLTA